MTLQELLDLSTATLTATTVEERAALGLALARGFMERLGEAQPCGWEEPHWYPVVGSAPAIDIPSQWTASTVEADDADHMARMLLEAADEARAERGSGDE